MGGRCHRRPIRTLGLVEVLGAIGLILPAALGVGPILGPLDALADDGGAIATHVRLGEINRLAPAIVLLALALFVAIELF